MYLSRLKVKNYRSIKDLDLKFSPGKNIIVGKNNGGKSNIIKAIDLILGENSPDYAKSDNVAKNDFYNNGTNFSDEIFILIELTREKNPNGELMSLNFEEINKCFGYYKHINKYAEDDIFDLENCSNLFYLDVESCDKKWIDSKLKNQTTFQNEFQNATNIVFIFRAQREGDRVSKKIMFVYSSDGENYTLGFKAPVRNEFLQSAIIPSFRDPQNQLRLTNWTWYGKLMRSLVESKKTDELLSKFKDIGIEANKIFSEVKEEMQKTSLDIAFPGASLEIKFNDSLDTEIYKNAKIYINDGIDSPLSEKGSGIQSATIIGLFNYYTKNVNTTSSALLCVEEPEIFLHPHARRVISDRLDAFADGNHQVIITTHSTEFIKTTDESLNIINITKDSEGTHAKSLSIKENKHLILDIRYSEIFFADKVILVEGFDEYVVRWIATESGFNLDNKNISVISVASKNNFSKFVEMLFRLDIPCFIIADFDFLLRDKIKQDGLKHNTDYKSHDSIEDIYKEFLNEKTKSKICSVRKEIKEVDEKGFYVGKKIDDIKLSLKPKIEYLIKELAQNSIFILPSDIEGLSLNDTILKSGSIKLSQDKIFQIQKLLNEGESIFSIISKIPIQEYIKNIYEN